MTMDNGLVNMPDEESEYPRNWKNPDGQYLELELKFRGENQHISDDMKLRELVVLGYRMTRNELSNCLRIGILEGLDTDQNYKRLMKSWVQHKRFFGYGVKDAEVEENHMKIEVREIGSEALRSMAIEMVTPDGKKAGVNINIWDKGTIAISKLSGAVDFTRHAKDFRSKLTESDIIQKLRVVIEDELGDCIEDEYLEGALRAFDRESEKLLSQFHKQDTHFSVSAVKYKD